jgi:phosphoribosylformylglycinamidine synthase
MSAKGKHGMKIWLHKVPTRQENMKPFEILLSESQERMLVVVKKGKEKEVEKIFDKWDLHCEIIGEVTETGMLEYYMYDELVAHIPAEALVLGGGAPVYERSYKEPAYYKKQKSFHIDQVAQPANLREVAEFIISMPNIASKCWVYEQYDSMVGINNISTNAPSDAALVRIKGTGKALALRVDCNARYVYADPYQGAAIAVSEAARNIVCSGGTPLAITNCLNFGNPYNQEVYWQFVNAIKGMGDACRRFDTPVTGGNVSFYNQSEEGPVYPTPTIGMLGILENVEKQMTLNFKKQGDLIFLLGEPKNDINNSEYLVRYHKINSSPVPAFDLEEEARLHEAVKSLIMLDAVVSAHDVSDGGLFVTLVESAIAGGFGFELNTVREIRKDAFLFGESQSRAVVSISPEKQDLFEHLLENKFPYMLLGKVTDGRITVDGESYGEVGKWKELYNTALEKNLAN